MGIPVTMLLIAVGALMPFSVTIKPDPPTTTSSTPARATPSTTSSTPSSTPATTAPPTVAPRRLAPVAAPASTTPAPPRVAPPTVRERGLEALALVNYPWERTGYSIMFVPGRPGLLGFADIDKRLITIYLRPVHVAHEIARVIAHEVGHTVDFEFTDAEERRHYRDVRGITGDTWYPECGSCSDYGSPAGDFAEVFAFWLLGDGEFRSTAAPKPTTEQLAQLARVFAPPPPTAPPGAVVA